MEINVILAMNVNVLNYSLFPWPGSLAEIFLAFFTMGPNGSVATLFFVPLCYV